MSLSPPSTFLCVAGSCTVVDKNAHTVGAIQYHMLKKNKQNLGSWSTYMSIFGNSRMQIHKKWLNQMKNFLNKYVQEYILAYFCW
jgi:hypothetical protein